MPKKILGIVVAGLLSGMGVANASLLTPAYDSSWHTFEYTNGKAGDIFRIGVSDVSGFTGGNSILDLNNLVGLSLVTTTVAGDPYPYFVGQVTPTPASTPYTSFELQTVDGTAGGACGSYVPPHPVGGDCSFIELIVTDQIVRFDWLMTQSLDLPVDVGDRNRDGQSDTAQDFAFYYVQSGDGSVGSGYLSPETRNPNPNPTQNVPEPATVALMAIGLLGAGFSMRRKS